MEPGEEIPQVRNGGDEKFVAGWQTGGTATQEVAPASGGAMVAPGRLVGKKEDDEMAHRFRRSVVAAALLATALTLAGPVEAGGRFTAPGSPGVLELAFHWLQAAWEAVLPHGGQGTRLEKAGSGLEPNGGPPPSTACTVDCDRGSGLDPNG